MALLSLLNEHLSSQQLNDLMEYNTSQTMLIFREYGRNIQKLVEYAVEVEDDEKRNAIVNYIIGLMGQMNPHLKNVEQFRHKLWDHIFMISQFKLEADNPYPDFEPIHQEDIPRLPYPKSNLRFKHYGKNVEQLIDKAVAMEDLDKQKEFAKIIGNYMKMVYRNNNSDNVDDETIREDLHFLSEGQLQLDDSSNLDRLSRSNRNKNKKHSNENSSGNNRNSSGGYRSQSNSYSNNNNSNSGYRSNSNRRSNNNSSSSNNNNNRNKKYRR